MGSSSKSICAARSVERISLLSSDSYTYARKRSPSSLVSSQIHLTKGEIPSHYVQLFGANVRMHTIFLGLVFLLNWFAIQVFTVLGTTVVLATWRICSK